MTKAVFTLDQDSYVLEIFRGCLIMHVIIIALEFAITKRYDDYIQSEKLRFNPLMWFFSKFKYLPFALQENGRGRKWASWEKVARNY